VNHRPRELSAPATAFMKLMMQDKNP
jgi:hypothetical protein